MTASTQPSAVGHITKGKKQHLVLSLVLLLQGLYFREQPLDTL